MSDAITQQASQPILASDGERDEVVMQLQRHFTDGRLTQAELEERLGAALTSRTRDQLGALTADLPKASVPRGRSAKGPDPFLLFPLLFFCPPAGIAYWLMSGRGIGDGWLSRRQLAGIPNWVWILIIAAIATVASHR